MGAMVLDKGTPSLGSSERLLDEFPMEIKMNSRGVTGGFPDDKLRSRSETQTAQCMEHASAKVAKLVKELRVIAGTGSNVTSHLSDLTEFSLLIEGPLGAALHWFENSDEDLADAVWKIYCTACDLMRRAEQAAMNHDVLANIIRSAVLPCLKSVDGDTPGIAADALDKARISIASMVQVAEDVRIRYVKLLALVHYLIKCTQLSLEALDSDEPDRPDCRWSLQRALSKLMYVEHVLHQGSDFWSILHGTELKLSRMEKHVRRLHSALTLTARHEVPKQQTLRGGRSRADTEPWSTGWHHAASSLRPHADTQPWSPGLHHASTV